MSAGQPSVAVIGAGPAGLVALKNLLEEGFDATGFDRNAYVGGLWQYTEEDKTSVLPSTVVNISKERVGYITSSLMAKLNMIRDVLQISLTLKVEEMLPS